jgi:hypothetical protein
MYWKPWRAFHAAGSNTNEADRSGRQPERRRDHGAESPEDRPGHDAADAVAASPVCAPSLLIDT